LVVEKAQAASMEIDQDLRIKDEFDWQFTPDFRRRVLHSLARILDAWWNGAALMPLANAGARYRIFPSP